jgi:hypothetical protein
MMEQSGVVEGRSHHKNSHASDRKRFNQESTAGLNAFRLNDQT